MNSSGIKRGLAATAISALAVTGIPLLASPATADAYTDQIGADDARLYTQYSGFGSVQNDGTNTTVHLLSGGGSNVQQVRFEYSSDGGATWTAIATVSRSDGGFSTEWAPPTGIYNLPTVEVQAVPLNSVGTEIVGGTDGAPVVVGSLSTAVDISNAPGSTVGVFLQPYTTEGQTAELGVISGKTSDVSAGVDVEVSNLTTGTPTGTRDAEESPAAGGLREFQGAIDFTGYAWDNTAPLINQAVVGAESGSDDAELVNLTKQAITTVTAEADPSTVQSPNTADGVVTVVDAAGTPVAGAQVFNDANNDGVHDGGETFQYTDANGEATFSGLAGSAAGTQHVFIVNTTDGDNYEPAIDFRRTVTVTSYTPTATSLSSASKDGSAFDFDEYTAAPGSNGEGDITVTVKDQNGANKAGETLAGKWTITPFNGDPATTQNATITDADNDGIYDVAFPGGGIEGTYKLDVWKEIDGNPGQSAGDLSAPSLTVEAGEANLVWSDGDVAQAPAGTTATFDGVIELDNHTALPNRNVAITWARTGNAVVAAQSAQPAGTTRVSDSAASATADGDGVFGVAIADPAASPNVDELGGQLDANSAATPAYGTNPDNSSDPLTVDFLADPAVSSDAGDTSTAQDDLDNINGATPGRPVAVMINVENAAGEDLTDLPVTVTTDHGFFTTPGATMMSELKADPAAADDANYGEWEDLGSSYTTTTDDSGDARAVVAIERDAGFDDDGLVTANVQFEVGGKTFTESVVFDSSNPMNPGEVRIVLDETQTVQPSTLPNAPTSETLDWDVEATDQFGNLTDETVSLSDNGSAADMSANSVTSNFTDQAPALVTSSNVAADQTVTGTWTADTQVWNDLNDVTPGFQGDTAASDSTTSSTKQVTGQSQEINWYVIDFAASDYMLAHTGDELQPVGTTVTMTYRAVDQNGEPIQGLDVTFFRTGPDDLQDGDGNSFGTTNADGEAFYVFQGAKAGTATVTAVLREDDSMGGTPTGDLIPQGERTEEVSFGEETLPNPGLVVRGRNNGARDDKVVARAINLTEGATVRLFRKTSNGLKFLRKGTMNSKGNHRFTGINDKNGRKYTKYVVKVSATEATNKGRGAKRVR